jgi:hypothetical protein
MDVRFRAALVGFHVRPAANTMRGFKKRHIANDIKITFLMKSRKKGYF